ncbi:MAG: hypothetical protein B6D39_01295 [Anaerolineae bacterium UTCFX2]|jgi:hypothetical protein|nr:hypothetical protein [Anaerolineae bacterium]MCZ7551530.1 hypothetical protein [Anaerolineales bacterium]OQY94579.1 MAG: hypothetical protein B6D39_01295 [Anaerolineae bacterium UTCFX2]
MKKRSVVLVSKQHIWGESLEFLLTKTDAFELVGWWEYDENLLERLKDCPPEILVIADDELLQGPAVCLTAEILAELSDLIILHAGPSSSELRIFTSQTLPAHQSDLIAALLDLRMHALSAGHVNVLKEEKD